MSVRAILLLGDPTLRTKCAPVRSSEIPALEEMIADLRDTLQDFKVRRGFGRGIAAPQIGLLQRVVYLDFEYRGALINPKIVKRSKKKFLLWDDCFSFPDILVRVKRNYRIEAIFSDETGKRRTLRAEGALSELLQHEIDHLDGILAIDRAVDSKHIILRSEFEKLAHRTPVML